MNEDNALFGLLCVCGSFLIFVGAAVVVAHVFKKVGVGERDRAPELTDAQRERLEIEILAALDARRRKEERRRGEG